MSDMRALQKTIHVGCKTLGLDADMRHELQLVTTGKASLSEMTETELRRMVDALKSRGFRPGTKQGASRFRPAASRADLRFVHVLWSLLGNAGALKRPGRDGLNAFVRSRFEGKWQSVPLDIDMLHDAGQINDVTRALKDMCHRAGVQVK